VAAAVLFSAAGHGTTGSDQQHLPKQFYTSSALTRSLNACDSIPELCDTYSDADVPTAGAAASVAAFTPADFSQQTAPPDTASYSMHSRLAPAASGLLDSDLQLVLIAQNYFRYWLKTICQVLKPCLSHVVRGLQAGVPARSEVLQWTGRLVLEQKNSRNRSHSYSYHRYMHHLQFVPGTVQTITCFPAIA
jgi:hypothetical protein